MLVDTTPAFRRILRKVPAPVREWALDWVESAQSPDATLSGILKGAEGMKGGHFRNCYARKWRKGSQGEYRLLFRVKEDEVVFFALGPREDNYRTAARLARALE